MPLDQNQKQEIILRAEDLFLHLGIRSVTMDYLANDLGISKKTLYQFFNNKSNLISTVLNNYIQIEQQVASQAIIAAEDAIEEMLILSRVVVMQIRKLSPATIFELKKYYPKNWHLIEDHVNNFVHPHIQKNIIRGQVEGIYRKSVEPLTIATLYVSMVWIIVDESVFPAHKHTKDTLYNQFMMYHIGGLCTPKGIKLFKSKVPKL